MSSSINSSVLKSSSSPGFMTRPQELSRERALFPSAWFPPDTPTRSGWGLLS
jgi:hypothetical protein